MPHKRPPAPGHALHQLYREGYTGLEYAGRDGRGSLIFYGTDRRGKCWTLKVKRLRGDRLRVDRSQEAAKKNPRPTKHKLLNWEKRSRARRGYVWFAETPDGFYQVTNSGVVTYTYWGGPGTTRVETLQSRGDATAGRQIAERHFEKNHPLLALGMMDTKKNPGLLSDFDPQEEQTRAQVAEIWQSLVDKGEDPYAAKSRAFAITTGRGQKYDYFEPGSRHPTPRNVEASRQRYAGTYVGSDGRRRTLDDLVNNRQHYEIMLSFGRKSGAFRVTEEPTKRGKRYFVWPMHASERVPGPGTASLAEAEALAEKLNQTQAGRFAGRREGFTKRQLAHWLPPASAFGESESPAPRTRKPRKPRAPRRSRSRAGIKSLAAQAYAQLGIKPPKR